MPREDRNLLQGTLDILILKTLSWGPMHGYGIASWIEQQTEEALRVEEGSLYPALHRMERKGWITSEWQLTENKRRAKLYRLTRDGRRQLQADLSEWERFAGAVASVLNGTDAPAWAR
ncbi:MAG TPA: PadR family transcriptional regulator [Gemmatimonadaceae bacterium]|nr:PadR family transcriptional regulator [Gemmatimonadaceae bacterium]